MEFAAKGAVGGESLQDWSGISEAAGLDQHTGKMRNDAPVAVRNEAAQRDLQVRAGGAAEATVAEQHGLIGAVAQQGVVQTDGAELVHDHGSAVPLRTLQKSAQQSGLSGAEESGDHDDGDARAALAFKPPAE